MKINSIRSGEKKGGKMKKEELKALQELPLQRKIGISQARIAEWYNHFNGQVYVAFSGGKDSTILLHLVRSMYPDVPAVFCNTGVEYPEIVKFVKTFDNIEIIKPKLTFKKVVEKYGYPVISKDVACKIYYARQGKDWALKRFTDYWLKKFSYLLDAPFLISDRCCDVMKKQPFRAYEKRTGRKPYIGTMACESLLRRTSAIRSGCNTITATTTKSKPLTVWTEQDVLKYIHDFKINIADIYGDIIYEKGKYETTGARRTGCMICLFGAHLDDRFVKLKQTHPKIYNAFYKSLNLKEVFDFVGIKYE